MLHPNGIVVVQNKYHLKAYRAKNNSK